MAEAVALAASIAGLVQLTGSVFKVVTKFCKESKDAPSKAQELATQSRELAGLLENLRLLASSLETKNPNCSLKAEHLDTCKQTLDIIRNKLEKAQSDFESSKPTKTFSRRLKWPFSLSDTKDLVVDLANHKATLHLALSADSMDVLLKSLAKQDELHTMIERKLSLDTRVQLNTRRKEVIDFFLRVNPQDYLEISRDLRYKTTGTWLTEGDATFQKWKDGSNSKVWLSGIPGSGKTVLCGLVIETVLQDCDESTAVCYAFCDYKNPDTYLPENIVAALAVQLGQQSEDAFDLLEEFYDDLHPEEKLPTQPRLDDLLRLVQCMADIYDKVYVVVDGLDECGDHVLRMTQSLKSLADRSGAISAALFSRIEEDIRDELEEGFEHIEVEAHTKDLEDYAIAEMNKRKVLKKLQATNPDLHQEILSTMVQGARGMFRWVACQIDHICDQPNNKARRKALHELPPTLFGTYDRVLDKLRKCPTQTQTCIRKALHWIALGEPRIKIPALCEAVSIQEGADTIDEDELVDETEIFRRCSCLIRKSWDGEYFEFAHFTVLEYLQSTSSQSRVGEFRYSEQDAFGLLVETAIKYLLFPCFDRKPTLIPETERAYCMDRNRKHPFYCPAAMVFPLATVSSKSRDLSRSLVFAREPVFSLLKQLFNLDKSRSLLTWIQQMVFSNDDENSAIPDLDTTPLHVAARFGQPELCESIIKQGANVNASFTLGTPLDMVISAVKEMHQTTVSPQLKSHASAGAERWARTLRILLDHGADVSLRLNGRSSLSVAFAVLNGFQLLPFIGASTPVPNDAVEAFYHRSLDHEGDQQLLETILEIADRDDGDSPSQWQPMAALALVRRQARAPADLEQATNVVSDRYSNAEYPNALWFATRNGLVAELSALIMDPRFAADGCRLLRVATESTSPNRGQVASILFNAGLDLHASNTDTQTCLHLGCQLGNVEVAKVLLDQGADISSKNDKGQTVWHMAASGGHTRTLELLYERDQDVFRNLLSLCADGRTPLSSAISSGHVEASLLILAWCPADAKFFESKTSLLYDAAATGSQELFSALLAKGVVLRADALASTPMHYLGASCTATFVGYLATMYDPLCPDALSRYPFQRFLQRWICHNEQVYVDEISPLSGELLHLLLPKNLEFIVETPYTKMVHAWEVVCEVIGPQMICCETRDESDDDRGGCKEYLSRDLHTIINHGIIASYENRVKRPGVEPLIKALLKGDLDHFCSPSIASAVAIVMEASIHESSFNLTEGVYEFLNMAIRRDGSTLASKLIHYGADVDQPRAENAEGGPARSSFETACSQAHPNTFKVFLAATDSSRLNDLGSTGDTPIDLVVKGSRSSADKRTIIRALCEKGASPKTTNPKDPAILSAAKNREWDVVECLANLGGNVFLRSEYGWGLAHFATSQDKLNMFKWVVALASDPSQWRTTVGVTFNADKHAPMQQGLIDEDASLLHLAANNPQMLQYLLRQGIFHEVNVLTESRKTPLHYAAFGGRPLCCQILLDHAASVDVRDSNDKLPIEYALDGSNEDIINMLIKAGSPLPGAMTDGVRDVIWRLSDDEKLDVVRRHYFEKAILAGDLNRCKNSMAQKCSLDRPMPSCKRCTPLFTAVRAQKEDIVMWLLEQGATTRSVLCYHNSYPNIVQHASIHLVSRIGMHQVLRAALRHGESFDLCRTPIYLAVLTNRMQVLEAILSHITHKVVESRKILKSHVRGAGDKNSEDQLVSTLVNTPDTSNNGHWNTPLHFAASVGNVYALDLLLRHGADVFAIDKYQNTALTVAARGGHLRVVKALIAHGAPIECRNADGYTAMAFAVARGHLHVVKLLDSASRFALAYTTVSGKNLASLAAIHGSPVAIFRYLVSRGVNPQHCDRDGYCALNLARSNGELINYLVQSRLAEPPRVPGLHEKKSPFARPAAESQIGLIKRLYLTLPLMQARALIDRDGWMRGSALCEAAASNSVEAAEVLLAFQADIEQDGSYFGTPLMCAIACGKLAMTKLLVRRGAKLEYMDKNETYRSGRLMSLPHPEITRWLLVGRFQDQKGLVNKAFNGEATFRPWSGKRAVGLVLNPCDQRRREESTFGFCVRLEKIRKQIMGKKVIGKLVQL
ncbi:hypothetical protein NM208_g3357 [Fusarium decemcellulare]|uniref:Uncharacterized protein n=1 Tax=Fusarium decemcellulare TaxID=57161 RepID=A0ACC1SPN6_9HYPO|nr:hypothetical protein NM208_g3357 [Fusarium decemcellulare]